MSKHKEDYLRRTQSESVYGFVKSKRSSSKQATNVMLPAIMKIVLRQTKLKSHFLLNVNMLGIVMRIATDVIY